MLSSWIHSTARQPALLWGGLSEPWQGHYELSSRRYRQLASGTGDQSVESPVLAGLSLQPTDVFRDP
jgi:hypothetical protein